MFVLRIRTTRTNCDDCCSDEISFKVENAMSYWMDNYNTLIVQYTLQFTFDGHVIVQKKCT